MAGAQPPDPAGARIVDRLHQGIAGLIDGNHVERAEVVNAGGRSCPCHLLYEVDWSFVAYTASRRIQGNGAVSTHFGYDRRDYDNETAQRCELGRTHKPIRESFMSRVLARGGAALGEAGQATPVWDFGQHSVHEQCGRCHGKGRVGCPSCHGSRRESCYRCHGMGSTTETRWVSGHNGHGRHETYQQSCYGCGGSGRVTCRECNGSGDVQCSGCAGHGFFTDIMSVTVQAEPHVRITTRSELSRQALSDYLVQLPVAQVVRHLDFTQFDHQDATDDTWRVGYEVHTTVAELDLTLRSKTYMAAAVGDKALAFVRPPIFDDVFVEEITDLHKIWSGKKKSFSNDRARRFFDTYSGQPVLDAAMKSVAKLKGKDRESPEREVTDACGGYISGHSARLLGQCMSALLDKVSPPNSWWSWIGVMALPFLLLFLGAQNWLERHAPDGYAGSAIVWAALALIAALLTAVVSPLAASISTMVSALRRRAVPPEYRQHGRNWQPFKPFVLASVAVASLGAGLGMLSHHDQLPRWDNAPMNTIEATLKLNRFMPYAQASAWLKQAGFFVSPTEAVSSMHDTEPVVFDLQNNLKRLGYKVAATGRMDEATRQAIAAYARKRKLKTTEPQAVLASLCKDLRGACANVSQIR